MTKVPRPSRTYKDGIGKPVVKKIWDDIARMHLWEVVFPPCNDFGCWIVEPEARLVGEAQRWCFGKNSELIRIRNEADRAAAKAAKDARAAGTESVESAEHRRRAELILMHSRFKATGSAS